MSRTLTKDQEKQLLKEFEEMLDNGGNSEKFNNLKLDSNGDIVLFDDEEDFGTFAVYPSGVNEEYPEDTPPPIPEENGCKHEKRKVVWISNNMKYLYCPSCKSDLGDA